MTNEPDFVYDIEKSIRLELFFLVVYLLENAIDLAALLAFCAFGVQLVYCMLGIALGRAIVFVITFMTQRRQMSKKTRQYFLIRKLLNVFLWVTLAAGSYLYIGFKPAIFVQIIIAFVMFAENCNCTGDVI